MPPANGHAPWEMATIDANCRSTNALINGCTVLEKSDVFDVHSIIQKVLNRRAESIRPACAVGLTAQILVTILYLLMPILDQ